MDIQKTKHQEIAFHIKIFLTRVWYKSEVLGHTFSFFKVNF